MVPQVLIAALWFASDPAATRVDVSGGVSVEVRGGFAPVTPNDEESVPTVLTIVTPDVDFEFATRRGTLLNLGYTPGVQYRAPNRVEVDRPILLHQGYATLSQPLTRRWTLGVDLGGSVGEVDYNSAPIVLEDNTQAPGDEILQIAAASGRVELQNRLTRRHTLGIGADAVYRTPLNVDDPIDDPDMDEEGLSAIPEQLNVNGTLSLDTRVTPVDGLEVVVTQGYFDYDRGQTQYITTQVAGRWNRQLRPSLSSALGVGVFGSAGLGDTEPDASPVLPVALASLTGGLVRSASHNVDATIAAGLTPYFDRVQISLDPRATLNASVLVSIPPRWSVRVLVGGVTNATAEPRDIVVGGENPMPITETQVRVAVPVTYEIDRLQQVEFGLLASARAPHLASDEFAFNQTEFWLYVAYRFGIGTARGGEEIGGSNNGAVTRSARGGTNAASGGRR